MNPGNSTLSSSSFKKKKSDLYITSVLKGKKLMQSDFCYRNGDRYAGEYFGDKIHGFGVYHFANGHYYEGSWHEGRKQGFGMYTFRNGESRCGEWHDGNIKTRLPTLTDAVLRAVQVRDSLNHIINLKHCQNPPLSELFC